MYIYGNGSQVYNFRSQSMLGLFYTKMYKVSFLIAPIYHCHYNYRVLPCHKFCLVCLWHGLAQLDINNNRQKLSANYINIDSA